MDGTGNGAERNDGNGYDYGGAGTDNGEGSSECFGTDAGCGDGRAKYSSSGVNSGGFNDEGYGDGEGLDGTDNGEECNDGQGCDHGGAGADNGEGGGEGYELDDSCGYGQDKYSRVGVKSGGFDDEGCGDGEGLGGTEEGDECNDGKGYDYRGGGTDKGECSGEGYDVEFGD